MVFLILRR